jgi:hypothetical protein
MLKYKLFTKNLAAAQVPSGKIFQKIISTGVALSPYIWTEQPR